MNKQYVRLSLLVGVAGVVVYLLGILVADARLTEYQSSLESQQTEQLATLTEVAEITARNGADTVTEAIVRDCAPEKRAQFDTLLGQLDAGLNQEQLINLDTLFVNCGSYFADRKIFMVARLGTLLNQYERTINNLALLTGDDEREEASIAKWQELVDLEKKQSDFFSQLVQAQGKIITHLLEGDAADSESVQTALQEAREAQENLLLSNTQAASVRSQLISL